MTIYCKCQKVLVVVVILDGDQVNELLSAVTLSFSPGHFLVDVVVVSEVGGDGGKS